MIEIPVSVGELIDKITILLIKSEKIKDTSKLLNVKRELTELKTKLQSILITEQIQNIQRDLLSVNQELWEVEDDLRLLEKQNNFGSEFIEKARSVYKLNDKRFSLKKQLNIITSSIIVEEKSYE
jgi:hypothetical protein